MRTDGWTGEGSWLDGEARLGDEWLVAEHLPSPFHLQEGKVSLIENEFCNVLYGRRLSNSKTYSVQEEMVCARDFWTGKAICQPLPKPHEGTRRTPHSVCCSRCACGLSSSAPPTVALNTSDQTLSSPRTGFIAGASVVSVLVTAAPGELSEGKARGGSALAEFGGLAPPPAALFAFSYIVDMCPLLGMWTVRVSFRSVRGPILQVGQQAQRGNVASLMALEAALGESLAWHLVHRNKKHVSAFTLLPGLPPRSEFCVSCWPAKGDSGGPLVCDLSAAWVLVGLASWGLDCRHPIYPSIFTRVDYFSNWIHKTQRLTPPLIPHGQLGLGLPAPYLPQRLHQGRLLLQLDPQDPEAHTFP
ncbi:hypothetical protein PANDA_022335 [Ailuropoda melanoleuca]|uniref:Peptidase S1 domain-containing protein n=1 Tax=Ailuropoda melanoleuca TaxID=9646 RepID=D2I8D6_AILME|nr:hypothetical protein PANDA_022335 [Ailuropoda melanoleuca]